jgi:antagonist of KipI
MDTFALRAANRLVGNAGSDAGIEAGLGDLVLETTEDCLAAVTGTGYELLVAGRSLPLWMAAWVRRGQLIELKKGPGGGWAYLSVAGGFMCPIVLGARATYVRGRLGGLDGRALRGGDTLQAGGVPGSRSKLAGREIPEPSRPAYANKPVLDVILGPQDDYFVAGATDTFFSTTYKILATSDRMGYRLQGEAVVSARGSDIVSDGMVMGSLQVPASGQPILMMADGPTTGGYPKIATVIRAHLPLAAQCAPGEGQLRFRSTTIVAAQAAYCTLMDGLKAMNYED